MKRRSLLGNWMVGIAMTGALLGPGHAIKIKLDYRYDSTGFFGAGNPSGPAAGAEARASARAAANFFESILTDDLKSIKPSGNNKWTAKFHSPSGSSTKTIKNLKVSDDQVIIFMGARTMSDASGRGGPGWYSSISGSDSWEERVERRGQGKETEGKKAKDFAPWGGHISMNKAGREYWHFNHGLPPVAGGGADFYSTLLHEIGHVLGIGTADSWDNQIKNGRFQGKKSKAANQGVAPRILGDKSHWGDDMLSPALVYGVVISTNMDHDDFYATREVFTALDVAALKDIGWKVCTRADPYFFAPTPDTQAQINQEYAAGLPFAKIASNHDPSHLEQAVLLADYAAIDATLFSGIPFALAMHDQGIYATRVATRNLNGRLSALRAGMGAPRSNSQQVHRSVPVRAYAAMEVSPLPDASSDMSDATFAVSGEIETSLPVEDPRFDRWSFYTAGDFGFQDQDALGELASGLNAETVTGSAGVERQLTEHTAIGFAWSYVEHDVDLDALGDIDMDGYALSVYGTFQSGPFYADLLYAFSNLESDTTRNTGIGSRARGESDVASHYVDLNLGYNWQLGQITTGPIAGARYATGSVDPYLERGAGNANLRYAGQNFDSLVTQLGWQASLAKPTDWGGFLLQGHLAWEKEQFNAEEDVSAELLTSPYLLFDESGFSRVGAYEATASTSQPGTDYLSLGVGLTFQFGERSSFSLDGETQVFRDALTQHYGGIRFSHQF